MRLRLLCVGRPRDAAMASLHDRYAERIRRFGVEYVADWTREVRPGGKYSNEHVRERESEVLLHEMAGPGTVIALDRSGRPRASEDLARRLERWATPRATFAIGGPLGHHPVLLDRADHVWSLSILTFPHELVRILVAEQLYRALTILRGVPYHND